MRQQLNLNQLLAIGHVCNIFKELNSDFTQDFVLKEDHEGLFHTVNFKLDLTPNHEGSDHCIAIYSVETDQMKGTRNTTANISPELVIVAKCWSEEQFASWNITVTAFEK